MPYGDEQYGQSQYGSNYSEELFQHLNPDLMGYLPRYYEKSAIMKAIQEVAAPELGRLKYTVTDILSQYFINTATWGLALWEKELGIPIDTGKPTEQRRSVVKAKLRGIGTVTKAMIRQTAEAYSGGEAEVMEYPAEYRFVIRFTGQRGVPPNMGDLTRTIEGIKPAHLAVSFEYTYLYWDEARAYTWTAVSIKTWDGLRDSPPIF